MRFDNAEEKVKLKAMLRAAITLCNDISNHIDVAELEDATDVDVLALHDDLQKFLEDM